MEADVPLLDNSFLEYSPREVVDGDRGAVISPVGI
jgi:hypothetical protein